MAEWKIIEEFPNYEVSDDGRVRTRPGIRRAGWSHRYVGAHEVKPRPNPAGYLRVRLWNGSKHVDRYIHRLVADAFLPADPTRPQTNHKKGEKPDNRKMSLERCTQLENNLHRARVLRTGVGENHGGSKLTEAIVAAIRLDTRPHRAIARDYGIASGHVSKIKSGKLWAPPPQPSS